LFIQFFSFSLDEKAENIRVYLRIKPPNDDSASRASSNCLALEPDQSTVTAFTGSKAESFAYDCVGGPETEQEGVFESVAKPVTEYCLQGYNGTIFA
jgi:kinesin family protein 15